jgi:hypothetical protein
LALMAQFPDDGILWRGWEEETLQLIQEKGDPVLLFVADPDPTVSPFLTAIFRAMPGNPKLRALLHERFPALLLKADAVPDELKLLGAGSRYHIAVLSPSGLTPMVTVDPAGGAPKEIVEELVRLLERFEEVWRD